MERDVGRLAEREWDLLLIGGGIHGAGIARDAALRGLHVALVEKEDFGSGTTTASTRLIHGGLRYLAQLNFDLVREALHEREVLLRIAPHLVEPLPFLVPFFGSVRYDVRAGLILYDLFARSRRLPRRRFFRPRQATMLEPGLQTAGLAGVSEYHDAQVTYPERLVWENVLDAMRHGAVALNHAEAVDFLRDGDRVAGVRVRDTLTGEAVEARARLTVNATGPWLTELNHRLTPAEKYLRRSKGVHLVTRKLTDRAIILHVPEEDRWVFAVPWQGLSLLGTTDTYFETSPDEARSHDEDVQYIRDRVARAVPAAADAEVYYTTVGVRSLMHREGIKESEIPRDLVLYDHGKEEGKPGLVSLIGGKLTTYRNTAERVVDVVCEMLDVKAESSTEAFALPGGEMRSLEGYIANHRDVWAREFRLPPASVEHLIRVHGTRTRVVLEAGDAFGADRPVCEHWPATVAQVAYAAAGEMAVTLGDAVLTRSVAGLGPCMCLHAADDLTEVVGGVLGWSAARRRSEVAAYKDLLRRRHAFTGPA